MLSAHLRSVFGKPVRKVPFALGLSCPNRDGTVGRGGCAFCSGDELVPRWRVDGETVRAQVARGISAMGGAEGLAYIAYLQDHTGTSCAPRRLASACDEALSVEGVLGLSIGTRPDSITPEMWVVLGELHSRTSLWLELGLQTACDRTLSAIGRCHTVADFTAAAAEARRRGIAVVAHVMLGLPGDGPAKAVQTASLLAEAGVVGVKLHNTLVLHGTRLEAQWTAGAYTPLSLDEYCDLAVRFLERLPAGVVVHRLAADAPRRLLAAPGWAGDKGAVGAAVAHALEARGTRQGARAAHMTTLPATAPARRHARRMEGST